MGMIKRGYMRFCYRFNLKMVGRICLFLCLALFSSTCIEPYISEIDDNPSLISIEGGIIKGDPIQQITITRTSTLLHPQFTPLEGCVVKVIDDENNEYVFNYKNFGKYTAVIPDESLVFNRNYRLMITTPDGNIYESHYEKLKRSLEIDTLYYEIEERTTIYTENNFNGLQFYVDIKASDTISRYFRWKLDETYEYTTTGPISYIYRFNNLGEFEKYVPSLPPWRK